MILALTLALPVLAAKKAEAPDTISARRAFTELPAVYLELLSRNTRLDMLDYYDNDSIYRATNNLRGQSWLDTVAPGYLSVNVSPVSTLQIKILPVAQDREIVMAVYTTGDPTGIRDSEVTFFDASLSPLAAGKMLKKPRLGDFFNTRGYKTEMKEIEAILPFHSVVYDLSADSPLLKARLSYADIVPLEDARIIELMLRPELTYAWDGKAFKPVNNQNSK